LADAIGSVFYAKRDRTLGANIDLVMVWHLVLDRAVHRHEMAITEAKRLKKALELHKTRLSEQVTMHRQQRAAEAQAAWRAQRTLICSQTIKLWIDISRFIYAS
jgi:hypothetical protein